MTESSGRTPDGRLTLSATKPKMPRRLAAGARRHGLAPNELVKLYHTLVEALDSTEGAVAQFLAPEPDAGIEAVVYDLAYVSAAWLGKRVLYVNGTSMRLDDTERGASSRREPVLAGQQEFNAMEHGITRVVGLELYQMVFPSLRGALDLAPTLRHMPEFLTRLRQSFDLVLIAYHRHRRRRWVCCCRGSSTAVCWSWRQVAPALRWPSSYATRSAPQAVR